MEGGVGRHGWLEVLDTSEQASKHGRGICDMLHTARTKNQIGVTITATSSLR